MDLIQSYGSSSSGNDSDLTTETTEITLLTSTSNLSSTSNQIKRKKKDILKTLCKEKKREAHFDLLHECKCILQCSKRFSSDLRRRVNTNYWNASYEGQQSFILQNVKEVPVKRRRGDANLTPSKTRSFQYELHNDEGAKEQVCLAFFLNTLGYKKINSHVIYRCFKLDSILSDDKRGKFEKKKDLRQDMKENIFGYHPVESHYHREHSPHILYLPSDLNCKKMFDNWVVARREANLGTGSYSLYCDVLKKNKIKMTKLGNEECETCVMFGFHETESKHTRHELHDCDEIDCPTCSSWFGHIQRAAEARNAYKQDKITIEPDRITISVDLEKV